MRRAALIVVVVAMVSLCESKLGHAAHPAAQALRQQIKVHERLLQADLETLDRHQNMVRDATARVERLAEDLVRAERQGESLESLRLRDADLRQVESELLALVMESQRLRASVMSTRSLIAELESEVQGLGDSLAQEGDPLTGTWDIVVEPGGLEGVLFLSLDGTLVQGTYRLDGGWSGSMRGSLVANKLRLERIDSEVGFSAIYYGRLLPNQDPARIEGRWEATQFATGMPSGGTWLAEKQDDEAEP